MSTGNILGTIGAAVGFAFGGPSGAQAGWMLGNLVGGVIDPPKGPGPGDLSAPQIQQGSPLPRIYGTVRVPVNPVWISDFTATANPTGGKGGPPSGSAGYTYTLNVLGLFCDVTAPVNTPVAITRVWVNKKLVDTSLSVSSIASLIASALMTDTYTSKTLFDGNATQVPWSVYETAVTTPEAMAYRYRGSVGIQDLSCGGSKTPPVVDLEVSTSATLSSVTGGLDNLVERYSEPTALTVDFPPGTSTTLSTHVDSPTSYAHGAGEAWSVECDLTVPRNPTENTVGPIFLAVTISGIDVLRLGLYGTTATLTLDTNAFGNPNYFTIANLAGGSWHILMVMEGGGTTCPLSIYANDVLVGSFTYAFNLAGLATVRSGVYTSTTISGATGHGYTVSNVIFKTPEVFDSWTPSPVDLADIVNAELALNPGIDLADHDTSNLVGVDVIGFKAAGSPAQTIAELAEMFFFDVIPANPIRYKRRTGVSVVTIANVDTGAAVDAPGIPFAGFKRLNDDEQPSVVGVGAPNILEDHDVVFERGDRLTTEGPDIIKVQTNVVFTPAQAKGRAITGTLLRRASAHTASFGLSDRYAALEVGDVGTVFDGEGNSYSILIRRFNYVDGVKLLDVELNDTSALVEEGLTDENYVSSIVVAAAVDSNLVAIDSAIMRDADDDAGHYTAIEGEGSTAYPGGTVHRSVDNLDFSETATTHSSESVVGVASSALANWTGGYVWDEVSSVTVVVGEGQTLSGSTHAAMQADRTINSAYLGVHGRWEVIRFRNAALIATDTYTLTGLLRGMRGTEAHMGAHAVGDTFVLATSAGLRRASGEVSDIGQVRYLKAVTNGRSATSATAQAFTNAAVGLLPFSPTNLRATRDGSANITFSIDRRPRKFLRYGGVSGSFIPPADVGETYELDVYATSGYATILRTLTSTTGSFIYSASNQVTDFGSTQATVYTRSYTRSAIVGRGHYLQASA